MPQRDRAAPFAREALCLVLTAFLLTACGAISDEELTRRAEASSPTWQNYPEDIKGQIGAGPVAEWEGEPVRIRRMRGDLRVTFRVQGPWATRGAAMPVLLKHHKGGWIRSIETVEEAGQLTYVFNLPPEVARAQPPWVELKYPHGRKRVALDAAGSWDGPDAAQ